MQSSWRGDLKNMAIFNLEVHVNIFFIVFIKMIKNMMFYTRICVVIKLQL